MKVARSRFFRALLACTLKAEVTSRKGARAKLERSLERLSELFRSVHKRGGKVIFVGNGGSAAIASHMAVDYSKNGGVRSIAFNDAPTLTCLANDFGYQNVFAKQVEYYARREDAIVIISSSGRSLNILAAVDAARAKKCRAVVTFSGMNPANALRAMGDVNFYVGSSDYGLVELAHLALLHSVVDA